MDRRIARRGEVRHGSARAGRSVRARAVSLLMALTLFGTSASIAGTLRGTVVFRGDLDCDSAIVYVERIPGRVFPPGLEVFVNQEQLAFTPHILTVVTGTPVVFLNSDDVWHNVFSVSEAKRFNLGTNPRGSRRRLVFEKPGVVELLCNVHPEMSAYILVAETPYFARVKTDGTYLLEGVPAGSCTVVAWCREFKVDRRQATLAEKETTLVNFELHP